MSPGFRLATWAAFGALFGGLIGWLANRGWVLPAIETMQSAVRVQPPMLLVGGVIGGLVLGLIFGLYRQHQRRRWLAALLVAAMLILAFLLGGPLQLLIALAGIVITLFVSASILRDLYGGNEVEAFNHHLRVWFNLRGGFVVVDQGRIVLPSTAPPHLGPMLIIVRPGNAVAMINGSRITRICGPSIFMSDNFEYVGKVISLERLTHSLTVQDVLTADREPLTVRLTYIFGLQVYQETVRGEVDNQRLPPGSGLLGLYPRDNVVLRKFVALNVGWEEQARRTMQSAVRSVFAQKKYPNGVVSDDLRDLAHDIGARARNGLNDICCFLHTVTVLEAAPSPILVQAQLESERIKTLQKAEGEAFRLAMSEIAAGYNAAQTLGMDTRSIQLEAQRYMMEHITHDPATKVVLNGNNPLAMQDVQSVGSVVDEPIDGTVSAARSADAPEPPG